ncbi:hypothetical protein DFS34DRAFT_644139 [Phlyctochytrium arcticum]|nr:hypothetical protein DFS34DRAFT_644139 [Phlyctochytrium arcticum]
MAYAQMPMVQVYFLQFRYPFLNFALRTPYAGSKAVAMGVSGRLQPSSSLDAATETMLTCAGFEDVDRMWRDHPPTHDDTSSNNSISDILSASTAIPRVIVILRKAMNGVLTCALLTTRRGKALDDDASFHPGEDIERTRQFLRPASPMTDPGAYKIIAPPVNGYQSPIKNASRLAVGELEKYMKETGSAVNWLLKNRLDTIRPIVKDHDSQEDLDMWDDWELEYDARGALILPDDDYEELLRLMDGPGQRLYQGDGGRGIEDWVESVSAADR